MTTNQKQLKKFNQSIQIEIEIDVIAEKLLSTFDSEFPHKELMTETLISIALEDGRVSDLFNTLNGFEKKLDFYVGEELYCNTEQYMYTIEGDKWIKKYVPIGKCLVIEINPFGKGGQILIEYTYVKDLGETEKRKNWVNKNELMAH